jgi:lactate dehydrogenase-like 2-hydroxyacid dehydrogenase
LDDFEVLMPIELTPLIMDGIASRFRLHKLWEAPDREALLGEVKDRIRGLATGGIARTPIDATFMSLFPKLEIVAHLGVGYDVVDAKWAGEQGIVVTNTPDVLNDEVADLAMGLLIATVRQIPQADRYLRAGKWLESNFPLTATLRGRKLGILGLGRIGKAIANRAEAFGLEIYYHGRHPQEVPYPYFRTVLDLARASNILMVVAPGGADTRNIVDRPVLEALGPDGILINVARGSLVDEKALIEALRDRKILTAGLDVFADEPRVPPELIDMDHVVLLPHVASASHHTRQAMGQLVVDNLISYAAGDGPLTPVEETPWPRLTQ